MPRTIAAFIFTFSFYKVGVLKRFNHRIQTWQEKSFILKSGYNTVPGMHPFVFFYYCPSHLHATRKKNNNYLNYSCDFFLFFFFAYTTGISALHFQNKVGETWSLSGSPLNPSVALLSKACLFTGANLTRIPFLCEWWVADTNNSRPCKRMALCCRIRGASSTVVWSSCFHLSNTAGISTPHPPVSASRSPSSHTNYPLL